MIPANFRKILLFVLLQFLVFSINAEEKINFYTEKGTGAYLDEKNHLTGYAVEVVREMIRRAATKDEIELVPWARGYETVLTKPNTAIFSMIRNKEREHLFKWVGPLNPTKFVFIARKDSHYKFKSVDDAKTVRKIGCYQGDAREKLLIEKGFSNLECIAKEVPNQNNLKKLKFTRIDLWITSRDDLLDTCKELKFDPNEFEEVLLLEVVYTNIGFHISTSDSVIKKWQSTLDQMKRDGTYVKIMKQFNVDKYMWAL
ncbi:substrate-binding periplasmic protein [Bdellovibrio svalbardensis]|uniref:ABC transporter substrate-binding protein n=1 Tax=Bdellovibrio svalbardensis TaxID=2972972 RepID=A0ABT6DIT2_9BACT|nr:ABC transporter substrate-binding protein [Bdellovibrio svalbardensis]MDG0816681.1 ABC transporter substrate-binding protein [Bdellovibrio svalbardensis]